jgi:hypothetical protein
MSKKNKTKLRKRKVSSEKELQRITQINAAYLSKDLSALQKLATTGPGLVNDGLRRLCW